jgi:hypothetical protein
MLNLKAIAVIPDSEETADFNPVIQNLTVAPYMKRVLLIIPFFLLFHTAFANTNYDTLLNKLNDVLDKKETYDQQKLQRIENLKKHLSDASTAGPTQNISFF